MNRNTRKLFLALSTATMLLLGCTQSELDDPQKPDNPSTPEEQEKNIVSRIQSISYVPRYADGKARMPYTDDGSFIPGAAELTFEIQPSSVAEEIVKEYSSSIYVNMVCYATKSDVVSLVIDAVAANDGYITIVVNGNNLKEDFFKRQCVCLCSVGIAVEDEEKTSDYIQIIPLSADAVLFSDENFKSFCVKNFDKNGDGEISKYEAGLVTEMKCAEMGFASLGDIKYFENLTYLDASANNLTSLDVSHNTKLTELRVNDSSINSLVLGNLPDLITLDCSHNVKLRSIIFWDTTNNLQRLNCSFTSICSLPLSDLINLTNLDVSYTDIGIECLDVSCNSQLVELGAMGSSGYLDVSKNSALAILRIEPDVKLIVVKGLNSSIYQIGQSVLIDGVLGTVYQTNPPYIVSQDEELLAWGSPGISTGATSLDDGVFNTNMIESDSPAAQWCREKGEDWYLPAKSELVLCNT